MVMAEADGGETAARLRAEMVALLRERGSVSDPRVIAALETVPRHVFVPGSQLAEAYDDRAIVTHLRDGVPISSASQPAIVAIMLEQLRAPVGGSVLEIGAGTGYNAALLATLVGPSGRVVTVDIDPEVAVEARAHLSEAGIANATVVCGDGAMGRADGAPYDGIIVTAGVADLSPGLGCPATPWGAACGPAVDPGRAPVRRPDPRRRRPPAQRRGVRCHVHAADRRHGERGPVTARARAPGRAGACAGGHGGGLRPDRGGAWCPRACGGYRHHYVVP